MTASESKQIRQDRLRSEFRETKGLLIGCLLLSGMVGCNKQPAAGSSGPGQGDRPSARRDRRFQPLQRFRRASAKHGAGVQAARHRASAFTGRLGWIRDVQVGDTLAKGTVIAELDEGDLRRAKESAEARVAQLEARVATDKENLDIATRNFQRFANSAGSVSQAARDDADARRVSAAGELATDQQALADARVHLDQANDNYANRQLIVPFRPRDRRRKAHRAGRAQGGTRGGVPADRHLHGAHQLRRARHDDRQAGADTAAVQRVFLGQKLPVTADAFEGRTLTGTVTKIAPEADPKTRTFLTQLTLTNEEVAPGQLLLRPGMIVTVRVGAQLDHKVMLLPMAAIHQGASPDELMVYEEVTENGRELVERGRSRWAVSITTKSRSCRPAATCMQAPRS